MSTHKRQIWVLKHIQVHIKSKIWDFEQKRSVNMSAHMWQSAHMIANMGCSAHISAWHSYVYRKMFFKPGMICGMLPLTFSFSYGWNFILDPLDSDLRLLVTLQSWVQTLGATLPIRLAYSISWWGENIVFATVPKLLNTIPMYVK